MRQLFTFFGKSIKASAFVSAVIILIMVSTLPASGQYFGQNKVRYKNLKFKVNQTPHFELYYYLKNDSMIKNFLQESEVWYELHQQVFRDTLTRKNPLILYANHPDFQQTTALQGEISVGTGGVTEGMKNRVIMPVMEIAQQTRHVLGHELVHAFQYHSLIEGDSTNLENIGNLPLWMVEGMAEYLSIGKVDAFTAMWMRDAYLNKDIPSLRDLTESNKYFPYRYGQAFWSYIGSTYGDTVIVPLFKATAKYGYQTAIKQTFGYDERTLSNLWKTSVEQTYKPFLKDTAQTPIGKKIIDNKNGGEMNVAPAISPNGKYLAYLSEKELFSIDLFLADAETGRTIRKLGSKATNSHIEEFSFIESAGAWSPDSRKFAFSIFSKGRNRLLIIDAMNGRTIKTESVKDVEQFSNLAWSPDGQSIVFTGLREGQSDLYSFNLKTKKAVALTNDKYSDYQPSFSSDGKLIVFSTDRATYDASKGVDISLSMALLNLETKEITRIPVFKGANNLNPQFSKDNSQIYFLSNRDGFRNMYRYTINGGKVEQLTDYFTGISGITEYSPALSVSKTDDIIYSYYRSQRYTIYKAKPADFNPKEVDPNALNFDAAVLPPPKSGGVDVVNANLENFERFETISTDSIKKTPYKPKFQLDYLSSNGVGASVGRFGTGLSSGIQGIFSDILGRNQIYAAAAINGEVYDFGGQLAYINQKSRVNWGFGASHIPYVNGYYVQDIEKDSDGSDVYVEGYDMFRTFEDQAQLFSSYPLSRAVRFEAGVGVSRYSYRIDRFASYYRQNSFVPFDSNRKKLSKEAAERYYQFSLNAFTIAQVNAAFVGDNSYFGVTSPLSGFRYRIGAEAYTVDYNFTAVTADFRRYIRLKPITVAGRIYSYSRLGKDQEGRMYPLFIGYPYLIRGYEANSFYNRGAITSPRGQEGFDIDQLVGSKTAVANFEIRLPFTGPEKLAAFPSKFLFSDLNAFFDVGLAWNQNSKVAFRKKARVIGQQQVPTQDPTKPLTENIYERIPVMSAGLSLRVNVFGYFVIEPYFAIPFQRTDVNTGVFGLTFAPGW